MPNFNHNTNINHNVNFRQNNTDLLHGIWHALNKPVFFFTFTLCTPGSDTIIVVTKINSQTGVPISNAYYNADLTPYVGDPADLTTC